MRVEVEGDGVVCGEELLESKRREAEALYLRIVAPSTVCALVR